MAVATLSGLSAVGVSVWLPPAQRERVIPEPVVITVEAVDNLAPAAEGRQWTADQYRGRDAVLQALGVPTFSGRRRRSRHAGQDEQERAWTGHRILHDMGPGAVVSCSVSRAGLRRDNQTLSLCPRDAPWQQ
jgi:hypothetical protein